MRSENLFSGQCVSIDDFLVDSQPDELSQQLAGNECCEHSENEEIRHQSQLAVLVFASP